MYIDTGFYLLYTPCLSYSVFYLCRGGATVLKAGDRFFDPHFLASGGGTKYCLDS